MALPARFKLLIKDLIPPLALRALRGELGKPTTAQIEKLKRDSFYSGLIKPGSLCFDIGANIGNRVDTFRSIGFRVVALEPQPHCYAILKSNFGDDARVTLVNKAVGSAPGQATMQVSKDHVLSTLSKEFIAATTESGRFADTSWDQSITVALVTLDELIAQYGVPDFIKVDVEGYELEVIRGLSRPIKLISLEWTPELTDSLIACISHLSQLGQISCNFSWQESMRLARNNWMSTDAMISLLNQYREETFLFGDIYIRSGDVA